MKFTPEVIAALAVLRANAENDFERYRLDVLERDLTAPPKVEVIDDTHQRFNDEVYTKNPSGHFRNPSHSIHRAVWLYYNGKIPVGNYNIHHRDFNPANNNIDNLQLVTVAEHAKIHKQPKLIKKICPVCNKSFTTARDTQVFCSLTCFGKHYSEIKRHPPVEKICPICGKTFTVKYRNCKQVCCSPSCGKKYNWANGVYDVTVEKTCPICGQSFIAKSKRAIYCSKHCADKASENRLKEKVNK